MIERDKKLHFAGNAVLFVLGAMVADYNGGVLPTQLLAGWALAMTASIAKEVVWDLLLKRGQPSWADMLANLAGQAAGALVVLLAWIPVH